MIIVGVIMAVNENTDYIVINLIGLFLLHFSCKGDYIINKDYGNREAENAE